MLEMKQAGAVTDAQDEASSIVFGMPKEAIQFGAVDKGVAPFISRRGRN
jgi:two-component system, chemotaxis family, protein-glutamate methylesterase/glutaminase